MHFFTLSSANESDSTETGRRRLSLDGRRRKKGGAETSVEGAEEFVSPGCESARQSPRELGSTIIVCVGALLIVFLVRKAANHGIWCACNLALFVAQFHRPSLAVFIALMQWCRYLQRRKDPANFEYGAQPIPCRSDAPRLCSLRRLGAWEMPVFLVMFLGVAESAGEVG
eukprot:620544-Rhodomonas_salina.2